MSSLNIGVYIGRFQPFHKGHLHLIKTALGKSEYLIIVIGSVNRHASIKNPFTFFERAEMIRFTMLQELKTDFEELSKRIKFVKSEDNLYKEWTWKSEITKNVNKEIQHIKSSRSVDNVNVTLYGHSKDETSYYLEQFPEWNMFNVDNYRGIDATGIRKTFFESGIVSDYVLPHYVAKFLHQYKKTATYSDLKEEYNYYKREKEMFSSYPFHETLSFMCSDAVVMCMGNVLLVKRKHAPGKNTWALPGGFKNANETFEQCCIRELREETNLRVPEKIILGSIQHVCMFDDPKRTLGIPRVTMGYLIDIGLNQDGSLPRVSPADDAIEAKWFPLSDIEYMPLFDDHRDIIEYFN